MKKQYILAISLLSTIAYGQVGVNTDTPAVTLDIVGKPTQTTIMDGIIAPRIEGAQLRAKTYTSAQTGALVYVTLADNAPAGQTIDVTTTGYYYFNGTKWVSTGSASGSGTDTNIYNSNGSLTGPGVTRTLTLNGKSMDFVGAERTTSWDSEGRIYQDSNNPSADAVMGFRAGSSVLWLQQWNDSASGIIASGSTTELNLSTNYTNAPAPIILATSPGGNTAGIERMRITGEGNIGIDTNYPSEKLDNNGITRLRTLPLDGTPNAINTDNDGNTSASQDQTFTATRTVVADANGVLGSIEGLPSNIYNANGSLTNDRTLNTNGHYLNFTGTQMRTTWDPAGTLTQEGLSTSPSKYANMILISPDNNSNGLNSRMHFQIYPESYAQIIASDDATGLGLSTNNTATSAPITFSTSAGSNAQATEKVRITGEGNMGINTTSPTEKLDNNGITRLRTLPLNGATNAINTTSAGALSASQNQTFTATKTLVADDNGVIGYVTGLPVTASSGTINVGETVSQIYSIPTATATAASFNLGTYVTANSLPALPVVDGLQINLQGVNGNYYDPRIYNTAAASQLVSFQTFATQVNENKTSLNNTMTAGSFVQVDQNNIVFWSTTAAEVETANVQVQVDATTYRWYEFKWWCMEISGTKKIFLSVMRKA